MTRKKSQERQGMALSQQIECRQEMIRNIINIKNTIMVTKSLLTGIECLLAPSFVCTQAETASNSIFILINDQDIAKTGALGVDVYTANMGRTTTEDIRFNKAFVSTTACKPSRYSFLTRRNAGYWYC